MGVDTDMKTLKEPIVDNWRVETFSTNYYRPQQLKGRNWHNAVYILGPTTCYLLSAGFNILWSMNAWSAFSQNRFFDVVLYADISLQIGFIFFVWAPCVSRSAKIVPARKIWSRSSKEAAEDVLLLGGPPASWEHLQRGTASQQRTDNLIHCAELAGCLYEKSLSQCLSWQKNTVARVD
jgi:hypothetical protein